MSILEWTFFAIPLRDWLTAALVAGMAFFALKLLLTVTLGQLQRLARHTRRDLDDIVVADLPPPAGGSSRPRSGPGRFCWSSRPSCAPCSPPCSSSSSCCSSASGARAAIRAYVDSATARGSWRPTPPASPRCARSASSLTVVVWSVLVLMALDTLGIDITALVAGLGVGGVAVALAVQNILGDLFASLSIVLDKPFVYGDFIIVDDLDGTVEHMGLKTTRVRSLSGEQLVFSNSDLLKSRIRNYKRMLRAAGGLLAAA